MTTRVVQPPLRRRPRVEPGAVAVGLGTAALAALAVLVLGPAALALPVAVAVAAFFVWQPLALLTLFIYVGLYKDEAVFQALPVDGTLLLGLLLGAVCLYRLVTSGARRFPFGLAAPLAIVGVLLLVSLGWTPSASYGADKTVKFLTLTMLATVAPFFLVRDVRDIRRFYLWTVLLAFFTAGYALANPPAPSAEIGRLVFGAGGDTNTIAISQLLCSAALVLLLVALAARGRRRWASIAGGAALIAVAAAVGSRGPILSLLLALTATAAVWSLRVPRTVVPILVVVALGVVIMPAVPIPHTASQRLARAASDPVGSLENDGRWVLYQQAAEVIEQHPLLGIGAGGFESVGRDLAPEKYPHNLFLELEAELGPAAVLVVLASLVAVIVGLVGRAWRCLEPSGRAVVYITLGVLLMYVFAAQLSGDINDNRAMWSIFGFAWLIVRNPGALTAVEDVPPPAAYLPGRR